MSLNWEEYGDADTDLSDLFAECLPDDPSAELDPDLTPDELARALGLDPNDPTLDYPTDGNPTDGSDGPFA